MKNYSSESKLPIHTSNQLSKPNSCSPQSGNLVSLRVLPPACRGIFGSAGVAEAKSSGALELCGNLPI